MIDAVRFDTTGFQPHASTADTRVWRDATPDQLSLHYFALPPDLPAGPLDADRLRMFYRDMIVGAGGGLVEVDLFTAAGVRGVRTVFKLRQTPSGMRYLGSLTLPFAAFSYVIKVEAMEHGMTGLRDTVLFQRHLQSAPNGADPLAGWFRDPYDPSRQDPLMRNGAEDEADDAAFPDHPLSRVRKLLARVLATLELDPSVASSPPFGTR